MNTVWTDKIRFKDIRKPMFYMGAKVKGAYRNDDIIRGYDAEASEYSKYKRMYFTIESNDDNNTITFTKTSGNDKLFYYSRDDGHTWTSSNTTTSWTLNNGDKLLLKSEENKWIYWSLKSENGNNIYAYGNIMSMTYGDSFVDKTSFKSIDAFYGFFNGFIGLVDASNLILPPTVASFCYGYMFDGCTSLVNAPKIPATDLTNGASCYVGMFRNCSSLVNAPALPANALANYCYSNMFNGCSSLVNAPELPAETLAPYCYHRMFEGCTSLVNAPALLAETLANYCYYEMYKGCTSLVNAPELPAETLANYCYYEMYKGCTSLVAASAFPRYIMVAQYCCYSMYEGCTSLVTPHDTTEEFNNIGPNYNSLMPYCYYAMYKGCTSLVSSPWLRAIVLRDHCYHSMFEDCTSLSTIYMFAEIGTAAGDWPLGDWVKNVASSGDFYKSSNFNISSGDGGIPVGWTVHNREPIYN